MMMTGKMLNNKNIVIIGGAGFIGHNMALEMKELGANVSVIDGLTVNNLVSFYSDDCNELNRKLYISFVNQRLDLLRSAKIPLIIQDARDYHLLSKTLSSLKPDVIVHLAAVAHANRSNKDPYSTFDHSLRTLENSLDFAKESKSHFIYFSSSMVYGNFPDDGVAKEETPCNPIGIYGSLKLAGEKMVIAYNQVYDMPYTIVRPSALYGERCVSRRVGQIFIENAINDQDIKIAGVGEDRLDFTYIKDLVNGVVLAVTNKNSYNEIFNLTYGESRSIAQMAETLSNYFPGMKSIYEKRDKLTPERGTLSVEKAKKLLNYNPQWPLEKGFTRYIEWYRSMAGDNKSLLLPDMYE